jgi:probable HAF family extracellular repeat protein
MKTTTTVAMALSIALTLSVRALAADYTVTNLGSLGGLSGGVTSAANGISDNGLVTGVAYVGTTAHVFLYDGVMHDLGPGVGNGINHSGQVTGNTSDSGGDIFFYDGAMHDLGPGTGAGINNSGQVTGAAAPGGAFIYDGTMHLLSPSTFGATAINNSGKVVGQFGVVDAIFPSQFGMHAFLYDGTLHDIGTPGGANILDPFGDYSYTAYESIAWAISSDGKVVGYDSGVNGGFLYSGGAVSGIGAIYPTGVNSSGQVVGKEALLYTSAHGIQNLNSLIDPLSGWTLQSATAINDAGQIVGSGLFHGVTQAFLLTPVPEPSTIVLAPLGCVLLLANLRRRKCR